MPVSEPEPDPEPPRRRLPGRAVVWCAALVAAAVVFGWLWSSSDYANTSLQTAAVDSTQPPDADPPSRLSVQWSEPSGPTAVGAVQDGTVIVGDPNGLRGLDPATGDERWHYRRTTARLCDWTTEDGVVVAAFRSGDGCDEALALDAGTGARVWYRNVSFSDDVSLSSTNQLTVAATPTGLAAMGTTYNGLRWRYRPPEDCRIADSRPGDVGVAVVLDCSGVSSLVLLDGFSGESKWTGALPPGPALVVTAGGVVAVLATDLTGALQIFDREGVLLASLRDPSLVGPADADPSALLVGSRLAVFTGSALVTVDTEAGAVAWVAVARTRPALLEAGLLVHDGNDFVQLDLRTGLAARRITVDGAAPPVGAVVQRVRARIVVSSTDGVTAYA